MELRQLEYFMAVSELKSFTKAAEKFYVSQPAVTNAISSLEKELNTRLFVRSNRHFSLTTEGEVFYNYIKLVFKDVNVALSQLDRVKNKKKNILKLAVCSCMSERVILPAYTVFSRKYPDARIIVTECTSRNALHLLESDGVEAAILIDAKDSNYAHRKTLLSAPSQIIFSNYFSKYNLKNLRSRLRNDMPVFLYDDSATVQEAIVKGLDIPEDNIMGRISNLKTLERLLESEKAAAVVPGFLKMNLPECKRDTAASSVICELNLYWRKNHDLSELCSQFAAFLTEILNEQELHNGF